MASRQTFQPKYSIVIPARNEALLIVSSLKRLHEYLKKRAILDETEVIVVATPDEDDTARLARAQTKLFARLVVLEPSPPVGKGRDVQTGVLAATGNYILFMDADLATPLRHCEPAFRILEDGGADIVICVRQLWSIHDEPSRKLISVGANWLVRLLLLPKIRDSQCGFKAFSKDAASQIFPRITIMGWGFDIELLVIASRHKLKVASLEIDDWRDPKLEAGLVNESPAIASLKTLKELLIIWRRRLAGGYN